MPAPEWEANVRQALAGPEPPRAHVPPGASGVLALLLRGPAPRLVLTRRTPHLARHPGEVCFPGGRLHGAEAPLGAALRETEEEVGVAPRHVEVVGHLTDFVTHYDKLVCAYVGLVRADAPAPYPASKDEVAEVLVVPLAAFMDPALYEGRALSGRVVHYWRLPVATVWGITGELIARLLRRVEGWAPPSAARRVEGPGDFVPDGARGIGERRGRTS